MEYDDTDALRCILAAHAKRYPRMAPCDAVKLIFQNEFGGGHLVTDPIQSLHRLRAEYSATVHDPSAPLLEDLGGGMVRVMLAALDEKSYPLEALNRDFVRSAQLHSGNQTVFLQKLELLKELTGKGMFPFSYKTLEAYLDRYVASGCPPVSHSPEYRKAYRPAYRIVLRSASLSLMVEEVQHLLTRRPRLLIAIDGRCASGKTTLAGSLHRSYGWSVVHMDHFFLRPEQRTPERYLVPGENIDHERFLQEVLLPLREGKAPEYRPFDCRTQRLSDPVRVEAAPVTIIEGSYSCHPELWDYYDLRVFLTVAPEAQRKRIERRDGVESAAVYRTKWIPLEEQYFSAYQLQRKCNYCI